MNGLIIKEPHITRILNGEKTWEIRGSKTNIRGRIALIRSGSGLVIGTCELVDCVGPLTIEDLIKNEEKHRINNERLLSKGLPYPKTYGWVIKNPQYFEEPIPYKHPMGAVIWVKLDIE